MIVGTAGHIDHGKTTLTRALTGVDTDRLKEEKARGISIELGYAYCALASGERLGIIDVPGHEKFIRTMASGVTGIDLALLVVAADDGIMPQTREHLAILRHLNVTRAVVAITKADRADGARLTEVENDIAMLLAHTPFDGAPLFRTNATDPQDPGVAGLLAYFDSVAADLPGHGQDKLFRLGVDRSFVLAGRGTVITGTALSGSVAVGDSLVLAPGGETVRVRAIHAQNQAADSGHAGQRLALNLAGIAKGDIERGNWLVAPSLAACSERLDADITLGADAPALTAWMPVHVHLGAAHHLAHLVPLDDAASTQTLVQLVFDTPVHAVPGDRFVLRNAQATLTIGGGVVLDPFGAARKRRSPARLAWLAALRRFALDQDAAALLASAPAGLRLSLLVRLTQLAPEALTLSAATLRLPLAGGDQLLIDPATLAPLQQKVIDAIAAFHARVPDDVGPERWHLKRMVYPDADEALWTGLLTTLLEQGLLRASANRLHLPSHSVELTEAEQATGAILMALLESGRFDPPWVRDLAATQSLPEDEVRRLLRKLARAGLLNQVVTDLFYHPRSLAALARLIATSSDGETASFRDATGLGRKRAVQVLEYFDRTGYTRRIQNRHLLRPNATWPEETNPDAAA
ncbi:selenocysteine-specific translation elongation factor [Massilia sp. S19_KUP03_FR1]|uniref:selenocysteine-specific translation elongation factor n=1 Tax=Massilia sp. S19_KUP03_FR1 TaxID=3025503 RepID=UPI002FCD9C76